MAHDDHTLTVRDAPRSLFSRWRPAARTPDKERRVRRLVLIIAGVGAGLIGIGALAWRATGNSDFFIAGLVWGLVLLGSVVAGLILARRQRTR